MAKAARCRYINSITLIQQFDHYGISNNTTDYNNAIISTFFLLFITPTPSIKTKKAQLRFFSLLLCLFHDIINHRHLSELMRMSVRKTKAPCIFHPLPDIDIML
jgi:hypothetical protein